LDLGVLGRFVLPPQGEAPVASSRCHIALLLLGDRLQAALLGAQEHHHLTKLVASLFCCSASGCLSRCSARSCVIT
jgi:hypothetical protein